MNNPGTQSPYGAILRDMLAEQGLSERQLAMRTRTARSTLRKVLHDNRAPSLDLLDKWLAYLGYELEIVAMPEEPQEATPCRSVPPAYANAAGLSPAASDAPAA